MLKTCQIQGSAHGSIGLNLSRAPWDPYPWVSGVLAGSSAQRAGLHTGDTLLELNGANVLGQRLTELAAAMRQHWLSGAAHVTVVVWRNQTDASGALKCGDAACAAEQENADPNEQSNWHRSINQQSLQKFATCLQHIAQLLECPVCLEVIKAPGWQCCNGHVLCNTCRGRSLKCPVCRVPLGPRGRCLLADKLHSLLAETFPCESARSHADSTATTAAPEQPKLLVDVQAMQKQQQEQQQSNSRTKAKEIKRKVKFFKQSSQATGKFQQNNAAEVTATGATATAAAAEHCRCTAAAPEPLVVSQSADKCGQVHNEQLNEVSDDGGAADVALQATTRRRRSSSDSVTTLSSSSRNSVSATTCCC